MKNLLGFLGQILLPNITATAPAAQLRQAKKKAPAECIAPGWRGSFSGGWAGGIGYSFNEKVSAVAGYRALGVDYSNDGFVLDIVEQGPIFGVVMRF